MKKDVVHQKSYFTAKQYLGFPRFRAIRLYEICEIFKNTFETTNNFVEHLLTAAPVKCYLKIVDFVIVSYHSHSKTGDDFFMAVRFIMGFIIPFSKESMKVKKVTSFDLFDTCVEK